MIKLIRVKAVWLILGALFLSLIVGLRVKSNAITAIEEPVETETRVVDAIESEPEIIGDLEDDIFIEEHRPTHEEIEEFYENQVDPEELELLATLIYCEAGSDACCDYCRYRVADVALNRMADDRFPDTLLKVLTQMGQYGTFYWTGVVWPARASHESELAAVERAYRIAEDVLTDEKHSDLYGQGYIWQAEFKQGTDIVYCSQCHIYYGK